MAYREILERQMEYERFLIRQFRDRLEQCPAGYLQHRRRRGENGGEAVYDQYYHKLPGVAAPQYLNRQMAPLVNELKYKRVLEESIRRLEQNVKARERYLGAGRVFSCRQHPAGDQRDSGAFVGRVSLIAARGVTGHTCWFRQAERSRAEKRYILYGCTFLYG